MEGKVRRRLGGLPFWYRWCDCANQWGPQWLVRPSNEENSCHNPRSTKLRGCLATEGSAVAERVM